MCGKMLTFTTGGNVVENIVIHKIISLFYKIILFYLFYFISFLFYLLFQKGNEADGVAITPTLTFSGRKTKVRKLASRLKDLNQFVG